MTDERDEQERKGSFEYTDASPVQADELSYAIRVGGEAGSYTMPMALAPGKRTLTLVHPETEEETEYRFKDNPLTRFMFTILDEFGDDPQKAKSILLRYLALTDLGGRGILDPWITRHSEEPGMVRVHPAVMEVAATAPMTDDGFDDDDFVRRVEEMTGEAVGRPGRAAEEEEEDGEPN